jgi:hypothetical protein
LLQTFCFQEIGWERFPMDRMGNGEWGTPRRGDRRRSRAAGKKSRCRATALQNKKAACGCFRTRGRLQPPDRRSPIWERGKEKGSGMMNRQSLPDVASGLFSRKCNGLRRGLEPDAEAARERFFFIAPNNRRVKARGDGGQSTCPLQGSPGSFSIR